MALALSARTSLHGFEYKTLHIAICTRAVFEPFPVSFQKPIEEEDQGALTNCTKGVEAQSRLSACEAQFWGERDLKA